MYKLHAVRYSTPIRVCKLLRRVLKRQKLVEETKKSILQHFHRLQKLVHLPKCSNSILVQRKFLKLEFYFVSKTVPVHHSPAMQGKQSWLPHSYTSLKGENKACC